MNTIKLLRVHYMPRELQSEILYVSEEFGVAGHLCPCGCGNKIITPLGPTDWALTVINEKPSLEPSIGSWQLPCQSHYWIKHGLIKWSNQWSEDQIKTGRQREEDRRKSYYSNLEQKRNKRSVLRQLFHWFIRKK